MTGKRQLRRDCFARIKTLQTGEREAASRRIVDYIGDLPEFASAKVVYSFLALPSEPDLKTLHWNGAGKKWAFSRVGEDGASLEFRLMDSLSEAKEGVFGFLEPDPAQCFDAPKPDLVLVPGVGFDPDSGARLGRGKGHYDRFFASFSAETRPTAIGVCFSLQLTSLETEPHDVPMDRIVTENGLVYPSN